MTDRRLMLWLLEHFPFEIRHDGLAPKYRAPGHARYHDSRMDALECAIYEDDLLAVVNNQRCTP